MQVLREPSQEYIIFEFNGRTCFYNIFRDACEATDRHLVGKNGMFVTRAVASILASDTSSSSVGHEGEEQKEGGQRSFGG